MLKSFATIKNVKGECKMGNAIHDKEAQLQYLRTRLDMFMHVLDSLEAENADIEDIDRLIGMMDDLQLKCEQFKKDWK